MIDNEHGRELQEPDFSTWLSLSASMGLVLGAPATLQLKALIRLLVSF